MWRRVRLRPNQEAMKEKFSADALAECVGDLTSWSVFQGPCEDLVPLLPLGDCQTPLNPKSLEGLGTPFRFRSGESKVSRSVARGFEDSFGEFLFAF